MKVRRAITQLQFSLQNPMARLAPDVGAQTFGSERRTFYYRWQRRGATAA